MVRLNDDVFTVPDSSNGYTSLIHLLFYLTLSIFAFLAPSQPVNQRGVLLPPQNDIRVPRVSITWDKPQQENGVITRYNILYEYGSNSSTRKTVNITDINTLSYTMNVLGEKRLRFRIKATTIKEGSYTSYNYVTIPAYRKSF
jgi:hypothetical protein